MYNKESNNKLDFYHWVVYSFEIPQNLMCKLAINVVLNIEFAQDSKFFYHDGIRSEVMRLLKV